MFFDIFEILGPQNWDLEMLKKCCIRLICFSSFFGSFGEVNLAKIIAKNLAKIEKPPFLEPQNMKISPAKIQKSVGKKSGQLLSRDRLTQKLIVEGGEFG